MGIVLIVVIIASIAGAIWLMKNVPSVSNAILIIAGLATFLGVLIFLANYNSEIFESMLSDAGAEDVAAPDIADLLFNVKYKAAGSELAENQKWWTLGPSDWVLAGSVVNKSDKELVKLKFEVFIKYGANIVGDKAVATQRSWKVPPGQERAFITDSSAFKDLPATKGNPIWGLKLVEINNSAVKTDIVWSPDNPLNQSADDGAHPGSRQVKTREIMAK
jgi:hypothetical protein